MSDLFARSSRLSRLLQFTVNQALAGKADGLKEYVLGIEVFDKDASFDPRTDTVVRVQARRLRAALTEYYAGDGKDDRLVVEIPTGGYVPSFHKREEGSQPSPSRRKLLAVICGVGLAAAGFLGWWWNRSRHVAAGRIDSIAVLPLVRRRLAHGLLQKPEEHHRPRWRPFKETNSAGELVRGLSSRR